MEEAARAGSLHSRMHSRMRVRAVRVRRGSIARTAGLYSLTRKVFLAGLGGLALTTEELVEFLQRLVDRGEVAEGNIQRLVGDLRRSGDEGDEGGKTRQKTGKRSGSPLEESVAAVLTQLNVPTRGDIESLGKKIRLLNEKIEELKALEPDVLE